MLCPRCEIEMKKVQVNHIELDTCTQCEGVWFDRNELREILDMDKGTIEQSALAHTMDTDVEREEVPGRSEMQCPRCGSDLQRFNYQGYSGILLDSCENQCGLWADDGELRKLFDYMISASKPDPEKEAFLRTELVRIKTDADQRERSLIDSLVMMDNRGGSLHLPGVLLQKMYQFLFKMGL